MDMTPRQLGAAIGAVYCDGQARLAALLATTDDPLALTPQVESLKADLIERLVALGHQRQALEEADRQAVDLATQFAFRGVDMAAFQAVSAACGTYGLSHNALGNLLASFNIITQYAAFELLAQQLPDEAARLGVG